jgi:hypothetical protein
LRASVRNTDVSSCRSVGRGGCKEPLPSQFARRSEAIWLPGSPRRAGAPARAAALSERLFSLALPRRCAGEAAATNHESVLQAGTTGPGRGLLAGVTSDGAESPPRPRVTYGEDPKGSGPPVKRRVKTHTASAQDSSAPVPWRWRSRGARIRGCKEPPPSQYAQRSEVICLPGSLSARTCPCQSHCPV